MMGMHAKHNRQQEQGEAFRLPTRIMKVICPRSITCQRTSSTFGDTLLGTFAGVMMLLSVWLRRASQRGTIAIYCRREGTQTAATSATETVSPSGVAKQVGLAYLPFPKQVPSKALAKFC